MLSLFPKNPYWGVAYQGITLRSASTFSRAVAFFQRIFNNTKTVNHPQLGTYQVKTLTKEQWQRLCDKNFETMLKNQQSKVSSPSKK